MAHFITEDCTACGLCLPECPTNSIVESLPRFLIDYDTCSDCRACVAVCPADAIQKVREKA